MRERIPLTQPEQAAERMLWERRTYRPTASVRQQREEKRLREEMAAEWEKKLVEMLREEPKG